MSIRQTIGFILESSSFIMAGFFVAKGFEIGWVLLLFGFFMAYLTGKQMEKDILGKNE